LTADDIVEKAPGELVTAADREAEDLLRSGLTALLPGSRVVGEEAVSDDPSVMSILTEVGMTWLVDPVDGTSNFAAGREPFAVMVALLRDGMAVAAWILDPVSGVAAVAERGGGASYDGVRVRMPANHRKARELRGPALTRYLPPEVRIGVEAGRPQVGDVLPGRYCAGYEYAALLRDEQQFAMFWRGLPWDHAPGILIVEEAGGVAWHFDGVPFRAGELKHGLLVAQSQQTWSTIRSTLLAAVP
jgi:fructose-1,6-bisphosphatase/inositol monophosphatase family enzyme